MKFIEVNNFVNEDDIPDQNCNRNSNKLSKGDRKVMENNRKELLRSLLLLLNTEINKNSNNPKNPINNRLMSKIETMNLLNTLKSSETQRQFEEEDKEWKTPLIEDFLPSVETEKPLTPTIDTSLDNHNWNNSELNYYNKDYIENHL